MSNQQDSPPLSDQNVIFDFRIPYQQNQQNQQSQQNQQNQQNQWGSQKQVPQFMPQMSQLQPQMIPVPNIHSNANSSSGGSAIPIKATPPMKSVKIAASVPENSTKIHELEVNRNGKVMTVFSCWYCGKEFSLRRNCSRHLKIHNEAMKKHKCTSCNAGYIRKSDLRTHMRIHTGEKPYKCKLCCKFFARTSDLRSHERRHGSSDYHCHNCDKMFLKKSHLKQHTCDDLESELKVLEGNGKTLDDDSDDGDDTSVVLPSPDCGVLSSVQIIEVSEEQRKLQQQQKQQLLKQHPEHQQHQEVESADASQLITAPQHQALQQNLSMLEPMHHQNQNQDQSVHMDLAQQQQLHRQLLQQHQNLQHQFDLLRRSNPMFEQMCSQSILPPFDYRYPQMPQYMGPSGPSKNQMPTFTPVFPQQQQQQQPSLQPQ